MLIIHGTVHTMDGPAIDNGFVAIREGKIWKVGPMEECPADWKGETLDARGGHILPGFVDAHCHLGMFGDAMGAAGRGAKPPGRPPPERGRPPCPPPAGRGGGSVTFLMDKLIRLF